MKTGYKNRIGKITAVIPLVPIWRFKIDIFKPLRPDFFDAKGNRIRQQFLEKQLFIRLERELSFLGTQKVFQAAGDAELFCSPNCPPRHIQAENETENRQGKIQSYNGNDENNNIELPHFIRILLKKIVDNQIFIGIILRRFDCFV